MIDFVHNFPVLWVIFLGQTEKKLHNAMVEVLESLRFLYVILSF